MGVVVGTQAQVIYVAESTRGVSPGSGYKTLRCTGRNINMKRDTLESAEVSTSRQRADVRHGFGRIEGALNFELSWSTYDDWLAYLMARPNANTSPADSPVAAAVGAAIVVASDYNGWMRPSRVIDTTTAFILTISAVSAATTTAPGTITFRLSGNGGNANWIEHGYRPGDWVVSAGWTDLDNNTLRTADGGNASGSPTGPERWRVLRIDNVAGVTSDLVCVIPPGFTGQATQATGTATAEVDYAGRKVSVGTTLTTLTIERGFTEPVNPLYQFYPGCAINSMSLSVSPDAIVNGTWNIIGGLAGDGLSVVDIDQSTSIDTTPDAPSTNSPFAAFDGSVSTVKSDGTHLTGIVTQIDFTVDNQRTTQAVVGRRFSQDVYEGVCKITGTVTLLLDSRDHLTAFQDEAALSTMVIRLNELGTNEFVSFCFNRVKYLATDIDPPANGPVLIACPFEALEQAFTGNVAGTVITREAFRIQRSGV